MSASQETEVGIRVRWAAASAPFVDASCRNCGEPGLKPVLLDADTTLPGQGLLQVRLLDCPHCGCAFAEQDIAFNYTHDASSAINIAHYVEVSAGPWPIIRTIARLPFGPGSKYLEIGCGFGFGLDYAITERGWAGRGIDPSPFAAAGRDALDLPIESRYFQPDEALGTDADVILASEVLEHIGVPLPFLQTLRRALAPGGVLALTTPNRARLRPDVPVAELVPILSVGAHLVLETEGSLRLLLERVGFSHIATEDNGSQLIAYASDAAFQLPDSDAGPQASYRAYLTRRAGLATSGGFLWWGLQARAYQESVAASNWPEAEGIWPLLCGACRAGFGFDPDDPATLPDTTGLILPALRERVPGPLGNLLYLRVLHRLNGSQPPPRLSDMEPWLRGAARAARDLTEALRPLAAEDQATVGVERAALSMLAASLADRADAGALAALDAAVEADPSGRVALARRCFVGLVNAGRTDLARQVQARHDLDAASLEAWQPGQPWDAGQRDALFCLGILELAPDGDVVVAQRRFALVRVFDPDGPLGLAALRGERIAADRMDDGLPWWDLQTRAYQDSVATSNWPEAERIWLTIHSACRAGFGFDLDDPATLPDTAGLTLPELRTRVPRPLPNLLYFRILHRLNGSSPAARMADIEPFLRSTAQAARDLMEALHPLAAEDQATVGVERAVLAMLAGSLADRADAGTLVALTTATEADPANKIVIARRCFVGLVNAGRVDLARQVQMHHDLDAASLEAWQPGQSWDTSQRDALFCLGMLELAPDGDLALARHRFALVRTLEPEGPLALPALHGERVAADRMSNINDAVELPNSPAEMAASSRAIRVPQPLGWKRRFGGYIRGIVRQDDR